MGQQPPGTVPGLQPTLGIPQWVILAPDKNFPALVLWSACQLQVAILEGETGEGAMLLPPPILISYVFTMSFFQPAEETTLMDWSFPCGLCFLDRACSLRFLLDSLSVFPPAKRAGIQSPKIQIRRMRGSQPPTCCAADLLCHTPQVDNVAATFFGRIGAFPLLTCAENLYF